MENKKRFSVAFSFPGEYRDYVQKVDNAFCKLLNPSEVFYDARFESEIAGFGSDNILQKIYHDNSELIVVFLCKEYEEKEWCCNVEWRAIRDLIKKRKGRSILPLRFDNSDIPGVYSIDICPYIGDRKPKDIAKLIFDRLQINRNESIASELTSESSTDEIRPPDTNEVGNNYNAPVDIGQQNDISGNQGTVNINYNQSGDTEKNIYYNLNEPVKTFEGRTDILKNMRDSLEESSAIALRGNGGLGKTQISLKYIKDYRDHYRHIAVLNASSIASLSLDISKMFGIDNNDKTIDVFKNWANEKSDWLIIYDNVDLESTKSEFIKNIVNSTKGHIIITTRLKGWNKVAMEIPIDVFEENEAIAFLRTRTGSQDEMGAKELANMLGLYPLALEQAAAYIESAEYDTYLEYIELYKKRKKDLLIRYAPDEYKKHILNTFDISLEQLKKESSKQLLNIISYFDSENILKKLFKDSTELLPTPLLEDISDQLEEHEMYTELAKYSLITIKNNHISIHKMLQEVIMLYNHEDHEWCGYAVKVLRNVFEFDQHKHDTWVETYQLIPHALSIVPIAYENNIDLKSLAWLYNEAGRCFGTQGRYDEAEPLYIRAIKIYEKVIGTNHIETATSYNNLAVLYRAVGRYDEAEALFKIALEIIEKTLGTNHQDTATCYNSLAVQYVIQGRYCEAEPLCKRAMEIREKVLGTEHPDVAICYNNLAALYKRQGRYGEAESLCKRAIKVYEKVIGTDHPETARTYNNLAEVYERQGRYEESETLYIKAIEIKEKILGADHPDTVTCYSSFAVLYKSTGRYKEAETLCKKAMEIREIALGKDHPYTALSYNNLSEIYMAHGKYEEAERLCKRAMEIREKILGTEHPDTATSYNNLAELYTAQRRYEEAEPLYKRAMEIMEKSLGPDHPSTASSYNNLAELYARQGRYDEAKTVLEKLKTKV